MNGGLFIRRTVVPKGDGTNISPVDFEVGTSVIMFKKEIFITDADNFTRDYMRY